jgi:cytochrome c biogenesis protein CcmG/thiol:disulfide interchange protein DsbE
MRKILLTTLLCLISILSFSQNLPNIQLKTADGDVVDISKISNGKPVILNFWATWCSPCKRELNVISEIYSDWVEETGVTLYAISIDDQRTVDRVKPYVNASGWEYVVLLDSNSDLKRALGINSVPFTILIDCDGNIAWQHNNYNPGDEEELYKKLLEVSK